MMQGPVHRGFSCFKKQLQERLNPRRRETEKLCCRHEKTGQLQNRGSAAKPGGQEVYRQYLPIRGPHRIGGRADAGLRSSRRR